MTENTLDRLMAGRFSDPDGGPALDPLTAAVTIDYSLAGREAELVAGLDLGDRLAVVCDDNTHGVLGGRVSAALASTGMAKTVTGGLGCGDGVFSILRRRREMPPASGIM